MNYETHEGPEILRELAGGLARATVVDAASVPKDVVTMNSTVKLTDLKSQETETYTLVYPEDANIADSRLSILAWSVNISLRLLNAAWLSKLREKVLVK